MPPLSYRNRQDVIVTYEKPIEHAKKDELSFITVHDTNLYRPGDECYVLNSSWLKIWSGFVSSDQLHIDAPDSIPNSTLIEPLSGTIKSGLFLKRDYRLVNKKVFEYLFGLYGADAVIYFIVPSNIDAKRLEDRSWIKTFQLNNARLFVVRPSHLFPIGSSHNYLPQNNEFPIEALRPPQANKEAIYIVDYDVKRSSGCKPYAIYSIIFTPSTVSIANCDSWIIKRRFKEFFVFNRWLMQIPLVSNNHKESLCLPSRLVYKNLSKNNLEKRKIGLEKYLQTLIGIPNVCDLKIFQGFLGKNYSEFTEEVARELVKDYQKDIKSVVISSAPKYYDEENASKLSPDSTSSDSLFADADPSESTIIPNHPQIRAYESIPTPMFAEAPASFRIHSAMNYASSVGIKSSSFTVRRAIKLRDDDDEKKIGSFSSSVFSSSLGDESNCRIVLSTNDERNSQIETASDGSHSTMNSVRSYQPVFRHRLSRKSKSGIKYVS